MTWDVWGAVLALLVSLACVALGSWLRARRPLRLADRIAPYVAPGRSAPHREAGAGYVADRTVRLPTIVSPRRVRSPLGSRASVAPAALWSVGGGVAGLALAALVTADDPRPVAWAALVVTGAVLGRSVERIRSRARCARERREIDQQVPVLADLLALAVSAGATPMAALSRCAAVLDGALARQLTACLGRMRTGTSLEEALAELADRAQVASLTRLVEAIAQAHARGTPLTEVVRAQATDARADERRRLLEVAGRKDVAMLVPIVFLVLPTVIVIAVFPGISALEVVVP